jgi:hypothetical protein
MSRWNPESGGMPLFLHIAIGVFLGLLAAMFVGWRVAAWHSEQLVADAKQALQAANAAAAAKTRQAQEAEQQAALAKRVQAANAQLAAEQAKRQMSDEALKRDLAWQAFYRKPVACDESRGGSWTIDCANGYMRAKQKFSELYESGKL